MIEYKPMKARLNFGELDELVHDYFATTQASEGLPELDINWGAYVSLEAANNLLIIGARDSDVLVGFVMYVIAKNLHHQAYLCASCDIIAVKPDYRGRHIASDLIRVAEQRMHDMGVSYVTHQFRTDYKVTPLFDKLGYEVIEHTYRKRIA